MLKNASPTEEDDEEETIRDLEGMKFSLKVLYFQLSYFNNILPLCFVWSLFAKSYAQFEFFRNLCRNGTINRPENN